MRILVADRFPAVYLDQLRELGNDVTHVPDQSDERLAAAAAAHDVLVVRSTSVTESTLAAATLRLIVRAGSGTNTIDAQAAAARGIAVCNAPGQNSIAVAELAFALLLALDRRIPDAVADLRAGRWRKRHYTDARGLFGLSVGVIGLGEVGLAFAERAAAFGMAVHAVAKRGRSRAAVARGEAIGIRYVADRATLASTCDVLSFHVPLTEDTRGLVGRDLLGHVRPGAWIINTSRGEIVDDDALIEAMDTKGIRAGLDVYNDEPEAGEAELGSVLARHPNVYGTHHVGASTSQAQDAVAAEVVRVVRAFQRGELVHCVNGVTSHPRHDIAAVGGA